MPNLPRRPEATIITHELRGDEVGFRMKTLSPSEFGEMVDDEIRFTEDGAMQVDAGVSRLINLFREKCLGVEGLTIGPDDSPEEQEPFDADNDEHIESIPFEVQVDVAGELLEQATLSEDEAGN